MRSKEGKGPDASSLGSTRHVDKMEEKPKQTVLIRVNAERPEISKIRMAAKVIEGGGTVAFPTETVYGLGANALNPRAVLKIFRAKKRPPDNPVIAHVATKEEAYTLSREVPKKAEELMDKFWPGPLTLILKASEVVPRITTAGLDTVAVRMPNHKVALALIREAKVPVAAPSANLSGKPSPTTAQHVWEDLAGRIDIILDGGPVNVGVESTVLDVTVDPPQVLRPGGTPYEKLREVLGTIELHPSATADRDISLVHARSPGMKHRHYAPEVELILVEGEPDAVVRKVQELASSYMKSGKKIGIMATDESLNAYKADIVKSFGSREDPTEIAKNLFRLLREYDKEEIDKVIAEGIMPRGLGLAVMNRLRRASSFNIVRA